MSNNLTLSAEVRTGVGKAAVRRLRRQSGMVPAIVYGGGQKPQNIQLRENEVLKAFSQEGIRSQILDLSIAGESTPVLVKDARPHPTKPKIMHIDFMRVDINKPVTMSIPLHFIGEQNAPGAKEGGVISHIMTEIELTGLPKDLPEFIEIDISGLEIGGGFHVSDIKLPPHVKLAHAIDADHDSSVVHISKARVESEAASESAASSQGDGKGSAEAGSQNKN
jgi:large subunit ribosomal protein L25